MKKIVRLTESDLEKIIRRVLEEQQENPNVNFVDVIGGILKIEGSSLFWAQDEKSPYTKIWDENAVFSFKVDKTQGRYEPTGYFGLQEKIFSPDGYTRTYTWSSMKSLGINPRGDKWQRQINDQSILCYTLTTNNEVSGTAVSIIEMTNRQVKEQTELSRFGAYNGKKLERSREGNLVWGQTYVRIGRNRNLVVVKLSGKSISGQPESIPTIPPKKIKLTLPLVDSFLFDTIEFVNDSEANQKIMDFVNDLKKYDEMYPQTFRNHVKQSKPVVYGYASIDADPNESITGKFQPCRGESTRGEYNKCLSQHRADKLAEILNSNLSDVEMNVFEGVGVGETDKFAKGMKWPQVTDNTKTAPNRRVETVIDEFTFVE